NGGGALAGGGSRRPDFDPRPAGGFRHQAALWPPGGGVGRPPPLLHQAGGRGEPGGPGRRLAGLRPPARALPPRAGGRGPGRGGWGWRVPGSRATRVRSGPVVETRTPPPSPPPARCFGLPAGASTIRRRRSPRRGTHSTRRPVAWPARTARPTNAPKG